MRNTLIALFLLAATSCQPVEAQDKCVTPQQDVVEAVTALEVEATDRIDHPFPGNRLARVWAHEDHFDIALFIDGCRIGTISDLSLDEVNALMRKAGEEIN